MYDQSETMRPILIGLIGLALLLAAGSARAEQGIDALMARAKAEGLPVQALQNKVREGQAKKVPEARVRAVVQQLMRHMVQARTWLRKGKQPVPAALMEAVAEARLAGLSEQRLRELVPAGSGARASLRVDGLVDLHLRGYHGDDALRLVKGVDRDELPALGNTLERLRKQRGLTHAETADALLKAVRTQNGSLHRAMQTLAQGGGRGPRPGPPPTPTPQPKKGR